MYDYLIVGSGLFGSVCARELTDAGFKCLVIDKRNHIGGNVYTEDVKGINVHKYGPHIFHTSSKKIWDYVNKFAEFNHFSYRPRVNFNNKIYFFPINMMTLYQLWGVTSPKEAQEKINKVKLNIKNPSNLEEYILSKVGKEIYETFIKGYTKKQWEKDPKDLPASIIKRIPIRLTFDDNYYFDKYQGIPIGGYTKLINNLLKGVEVKLNIDYFKSKSDLVSNKIIFTGKIDEYFNYKFGELEYRGLEFKHEILEIDNFQGVAGMNYTSENVPFTRIVEHKHFEFGKQNHTIITKEYPKKATKNDIPYYPINDDVNNKRYNQYKKLAKNTNIIFGGRLAEYKYYDMHQVIGSALSKVKKEINK